MSKQELKQELENIKQMFLNSAENQKDRDFWYRVWLETKDELAAK